MVYDTDYTKQTHKEQVNTCTECTSNYELCHKTYRENSSMLGNELYNSMNVEELIDNMIKEESIYVLNHYNMIIKKNRIKKINYFSIQYGCFILSLYFVGMCFLFYQFDEIDNNVHVPVLSLCIIISLTCFIKACIKQHKIRK